MEKVEANAPQEQTTPPTQTDPQESAAVDNGAVVDNGAAESESLLSQEITEEVGINPLTDNVGEEGESEDPDNKEKDKVEVNFDEIKFPEGIEMDEGFKPVAQELNLTQDQVQKLVDYKVTADKQVAEANQLQFNEVVESLQKETKEKLGAGYKKEMAFAARAMNLLSKEEQNSLKEVLNVSGIGNHHLLVKMFIETGKALSEDKFVDGKKTNQSKSVADVLFGDMKK